MSNQAIELTDEEQRIVEAYRRGIELPSAAPRRPRQAPVEERIALYIVGKLALENAFSEAALADGAMLRFYADLIADALVEGMQSCYGITESLDRVLDAATLGSTRANAEGSSAYTFDTD